MKPKSYFQPKYIALLIAALYAPASFATIAARVEFSTGDPILLDSNGKERPLKRGDTLSAGERIRTRSGRVQLSFTDGAFVSLHPETEFGVEQYAYQGKLDGSEKGFFKMLKGTLRTITGMIGRGKKDAYRIETPTATIGIRGTGGLIQVNDNGTSVFGTSGIWTLTNSAGSTDVPAGTSGFAGRGGDQPPQTGGPPPSAPPPGTDSSTDSSFISGDQTTSSGTPAAIGSTTVGMVDGPGYAVGHASSIDGSDYIVDSSTATFVSGSGLNSFIDAGAMTVARGTTSIVDSGNDGIVGWGRWTNGSYTTFSGSIQNPLNANQGLHYIVGIPTATMPMNGSASYGLVGATSPTFNDGSTAPGSFSFGYFSVDFTSALLSLGFTVNIGGKAYNATGSNIPITNQFSASLAVTCWSTCNGHVQGLFFGSAAERAGIVYRINNLNDGNTINGAAAFNRLAGMP